MNFVKGLTSVLVFFAVLSFSAFAQNDNPTQNDGQDKLPYFNKIVASGNVNIFIDQQDEQQVNITTLANAGKVLIYVRDSFLYVISKIYQPTDIKVNFTDLVYLETKQNAKINVLKNANLKNLIVKTDYSSIINLYIETRSMSIIALGSGVINLSGNIHYLKMEAKNAVQLNASLFSFVVDATLSDFADIELKGKTDELNVEMTDESFLKATGLRTRICKVEGDNFSEANVCTTDSLEFVGKKSASLFFTGEPKALNKIISKRADIYT
ncbi:MAG: DUF2807 domain-containing protein, partial [Bacteroidales bacterium]|nr:DUF2807 domain-containing protein [Bacteroidales bacterium]